MSSDLPFRIRDRAVEVIGQIEDIRAIASGFSGTGSDQAARLDGITAGLLGNVEQKGAEELAKAMVLSRVCVREFIQKARQFEKDPGLHTKINIALDLFKQRTEYASGKINGLSFALDRPILFDLEESANPAIYPVSLARVLNSGWIGSRPGRFSDVDLVEASRSIDHAIVASVDNHVPNISTIFINAFHETEFLKHEGCLARLFVHEERHVSNAYARGGEYFLQDVMDGFRTFPAKDTGLNSDRTRSNLVDEIDAGIEDMKFTFEEGAPVADRHELEYMDHKCRKMKIWAGLIRMEYDKNYPMNPLDPLDEPLSSLFNDLEPQISRMHTKVLAMLAQTEGR